MRRATWLCVAVGLATGAAGCSGMPMAGGSAAGDAGYDGYAQTGDTGTGRQLGEAVGAEVADDHGYLGQAVGGLIGQQTERGMKGEQD